MKFSAAKYLLLVVPLLMVACSRTPVPKPYGYYRLSMPDPVHTSCSFRHGQFAINQAARMENADAGNPDFFNIHYPTLNATIHCSYLPIHHDLPVLLKDAQEMVYSHSVKASAIPEQEFANTDNRVYGVLYELHGNTATPLQFFLTDSTHHFFRAAVYINTIPNQDSLAPVVEYLTDDVRNMIESFQWK